MPELPEVESIRRSLEPVVVGRTIGRVRVRNPKLRRPVSPTMARRLRGRRVVATARRGKYLLLELDDARAWFFHMGMSGRLHFVEEEVAEPGTHDHVLAFFREGGTLIFHDPRRFGVCAVGDAGTSPFLAGMGPEPLDPAAFHADYLASWRRRTRRAVKDVLMDQKVVAGLGNIYVNEILFRAGIRPRRSMRRLSGPDCDRVVDATRVVIADAVEHRGSTISDFLDGIGRRGGYQWHHCVYDRKGEPCPTCGEPIRCVVVGQRSSFYCPRCQR